MTNRMVLPSDPFSFQHCIADLSGVPLEFMDDSHLIAIKVWNLMNSVGLKIESTFESSVRGPSGRICVGVVTSRMNLSLIAVPPARYIALDLMSFYSEDYQGLVKAIIDEFAPTHTRVKQITRSAVNTTIM